MGPTGPVVIDWTNARPGPPGLDVAMSALILAGVALTLEFPEAGDLLTAYGAAAPAPTTTTSRRPPGSGAASRTRPSRSDRHGASGAARTRGARVGSPTVPSDSNLLFLAGLGRSGTTALLQVFASHAEVALGVERYKRLYPRDECR